MFGLVFVALVALLVRVLLKSLVICSALPTKTWLVDGELCNDFMYSKDTKQQLYPFQLLPAFLICVT